MQVNTKYAAQGTAQIYISYMTPKNTNRLKRVSVETKLDSRTIQWQIRVIIEFFGSPLSLLVPIETDLSWWSEWSACRTREVLKYDINAATYSLFCFFKGHQGHIKHVLSLLFFCLFSFFPFLFHMFVLTFFFNLLDGSLWEKNRNFFFQLPLSRWSQYASFSKYVKISEVMCRKKFVHNTKVYVIW